nr:hypothetical protein Iba_chr01aCG7100 [Ipomoea batatas]
METGKPLFWSALCYKIGILVCSLLRRYGICLQSATEPESTSSVAARPPP